MDKLVLHVKDAKARRLGHILSKKTSQKIIEYLEEHKSVTEGDLVKALTLPHSTVHYNLKLLSDVGLVQSEEYHYSQKGRVVDHYTLARRLVVLSPFSLVDDLKAIIPAVLLCVLGAGLFWWAPWQQETVQDVMTRDAAPKMLAETVEPVVQSQPNIWLWFMMGALVVALIVLAINLLRRIK